MFLHSCVQKQHSWQMYSMAMTSVKSWQLSYMALTIHWQYSCTALVSKKSLTTIPYGHQASWQKDAMDVTLKNTIEKVTKFYLKQKKSLTKFWCWQSDAPPIIAEDYWAFLSIAENCWALLSIAEHCWALAGSVGLKSSSVLFIVRIGFQCQNSV